VNEPLLTILDDLALGDFVLLVSEAAIATRRQHNLTSLREWQLTVQNLGELGSCEENRVDDVRDLEWVNFWLFLILNRLLKTREMFLFFLVYR